LKCGGGKALTKQVANETPFKLHLPVETASKVDAAGALVVCDRPIGSELEEELEVARIRNEIEHKRVFGKIVSELYDLEKTFETEKPLKIDLDLDLYQMEKV
jgi:hypothetical protein